MAQEPPCRPQHVALKTTLLTSLISAIMFSFAMSAVMTFVNVGADGFLAAWPRGWLIGFCVAFPISLVIPKFAKSIAFRIWPPADVAGVNEIKVAEEE